MSEGAGGAEGGGGAAGGGATSSGGYGDSGVNKQSGGGGSIYGLGDNPQGSGIGTKGQGGRTQNKTFGEIMALAPPPQFQGLRPTQGVMPGDKTGAGAARAPMPGFLGHKDDTGDYKTNFAGSGVMGLAKNEASGMGKGLKEMYESLFAPKRGDVGGKGQEQGPNQSMSDEVRSKEAASAAAQYEQPYDPGGLTEFAPTYYSTPELGNFGGAY